MTDNTEDNRPQSPELNKVPTSAQINHIKNTSDRYVSFKVRSASSGYIVEGLAQWKDPVTDAVKMQQFNEAGASHFQDVLRLMERFNFHGYFKRKPDKAGDGDDVLDLAKSSAIMPELRNGPFGTYTGEGDK